MGGFREGRCRQGLCGGEGLVGSLGEEGCREAGVGVRGAHTGEGVWTRPHRGLSVGQGVGDHCRLGAAGDTIHVALSEPQHLNWKELSGCVIHPTQACIPEMQPGMGSASVSSFAQWGL